MAEKDICEVKCMESEKVKEVKRQMLREEEVNRLSGTFSILSDSTRVKIIFALSKEELCVCDIAYLLNLSISAVSHQLRVLRNARLVKYRKQGKMVFYSLDDEHISTLFNEGLKHIRE
ncbi:MAG: helix-turn-helix transcriptional regulator [Caldiserica bacterium]|nr:helix-turn-helix transcriptional regulator [Caldisericota bacterium]